MNNPNYKKLELGLKIKPEYIRLKLGDIIPHPKNPTHFRNLEQMPTATAQAILDDIGEEGLLNPIVINGNTKHVLAGHKRHAALIKVGYTAQDEILVQSIRIDEKDEEEWLIKDNCLRDNYMEPALFYQRLIWFKQLRELRRNGEKASTRIIGKEIGVRKNDVIDANLFETLDEKAKKAVLNWAAEQDGKYSRKDFMLRVEAAAGKKPIFVTPKEATEINKWRKAEDLLNENNENLIKIKKLDGATHAKEACREVEKISSAYLEPLTKLRPNAAALKQMEANLLKMYGTLDRFMGSFRANYDSIFPKTRK